MAPADVGSALGELALDGKLGMGGMGGLVLMGLRLIVCGSRHWQDRDTMTSVLEALDEWEGIDLIIHGDCRGADRMARDIAVSHDWFVVAHPAEWQKYGRAAGPLRNRKMLESCAVDYVIAFHENLKASRGTKDILRAAEAKGIPSIVVVPGTRWSDDDATRYLGDL